MKQEQQKQAEQLFFQTDLTKSQIAGTLGISRRSLHYWIKTNDWDHLKKSAEVMPSMISENIYHILSQLTSSILSVRRENNPVMPQEVTMMHKLTTTINKLKNRNTLNESMEMMAYFIEGVSKKDPVLAEMIQPHINEYIKSRAAIYPSHVMPQKFNAQGLIPEQEPNDEEYQLDLADLAAWAENPPADTDQSLSVEEPVGNMPPTPAGGSSTGNCREQSTFNNQPATQADPKPAESTIKPLDQKIDYRKLLRGTATKGPGKAWRQAQARAKAAA